MENYGVGKHIPIMGSTESVGTKPLRSPDHIAKIEQQCLTDGELELIEKFISAG